jgi:hypothetical protein
MRTYLNILGKEIQGDFISLNSIVLPNDRAITLIEINNLIEYIHSGGTISPIKIDNNNLVIDGVLRVLAYQYMGKTTIPFEVTHCPDIITIGRISIHPMTNIERHKNVA